MYKRQVNSRLIQTLKDITFSKAADSDMKRENANIDADTAMGTMLKYGSESAKQFYEMCVIDPRYAKAPVSYTHLDVYKRQPLRASMWRRSCNVLAEKPRCP